MKTINTGLLLIAHGARDPAWAAPFQDVARRIAAARPDVKVELSFLEFMSPGIEQAAQQLVDSGCTFVHVVPMFLGASGHVRRDIPPLLERLSLHYGEQVSWQQHAALGEAEAVMQTMADVTISWLDVLPGAPLLP